MAICDWPQSERPREKLLHQGAATLSIAELLAILFRTGSHGYSALDQARELLKQFGSLKQLLQADLVQFCTMPGIGKTKYIQLQAAIELSRRYLYESLEEMPALNNTLQTRLYLISQLAHKQREVFACLLLNNQHRVIRYIELFEGSINHAEVHPRELIKAALDHHASAVIVAHNHPSGTLEPSKSDKLLTARLKSALELVDILLLDHIVVAGNQTYSFLEQGLLL